MKHFNITFFLTILMGMVGLSSMMIFTSCSGDNDDIVETPSSVNIADGHEYVDLGLSVKWATCNVGAKNPWEYGDYFAWGETEPKSNYDYSTYKWCEGSFRTLTKYNTRSDYGTVDNNITLDPADDAATANWGGSWRMPTSEELKALFDRCYWEWTTNYNEKGVSGYIVYKAKEPGDMGKKKFSGSTVTTLGTYSLSDTHIFLPGVGFRDGRDLYNADDFASSYWSASLYDNGVPCFAWYVAFFNPDIVHFPNNESYLFFSNYHRYRGKSVRPVRP